MTRCAGDPVFRLNHVDRLGRFSSVAFCVASVLTRCATGSWIPGPKTLPPICGGYSFSLTAASRCADWADLLILELANLWAAI
jgi:hypothetical protein